MSRLNKTVIATVCLSVLSGAALAHTTVLKKNTPNGWAGREELEGTGSISAVTISHGCGSPAGGDTEAVTAMAIVWPNGFYAKAVRMDTEAVVVLADEIIGNPVMGPKPVQDYNIFKRIQVKEGEVPEYVSHGVKTTDIRAFHYRKGHLETYLYGVVPYTASYARFKPESCAYKMKINFAIANYCTESREDDNRADIWIGELTEKFNDPDVVSVGFWPSVDVVRDLENNPLPEECGEGYAISVTPSASSLDKYLPVRGYWPAPERHHHKRR